MGRFSILHQCTFNPIYIIHSYYGQPILQNIYNRHNILILLRGTQRQVLLIQKMCNLFRIISETFASSLHGFFKNHKEQKIYVIPMKKKTVLLIALKCSSGINNIIILIHSQNLNSVSQLVSQLGAVYKQFSSRLLAFWPLKLNPLPLPTQLLSHNNLQTMVH